MSRRRWRKSARVRVARSRPAKKTLPEVGSISRRMRRPKVDFPEPDSPTSPRVSPASISRLTLVTALTVSWLPPSTPEDPAANSFVTFAVRTSPLDAATAELCTALDTDAGDMMVWPLLLQRRIYLSAVGYRHRAARMKSTSRRRLERARNRPRNRLQAMVPGAVDTRDRIQQALGVRIQRLLEEHIAGRLFHYAGGVEDRD